MSVGDVLWDEPLQVAASATALCIVTLALGALIRRWLRRATSLRRIVVTVVLASLSLGVLSAALAARLMLLDGAKPGDIYYCLEFFKSAAKVLIYQSIFEFVHMQQFFLRVLQATSNDLSTILTACHQTCA